MKYDRQTDCMIKEQFTHTLEQQDIHILKWLPYSFASINGKRAMRISYYRYGQKSPIPVYFVNYTVPMRDGNTLEISYSFQSNKRNLFIADFDKSIQSISFSTAR